MAVTGVQNFNVGRVNSYQPQFKGNKLPKEIDKGDHIEKHIETEATTGKKWGVGIASAFMSGLGQFINGDIGKGFAFLAGGLATGVAAAAGVLKGSKGLYLGGLLSALGLGIWSIVDAVKNAKSETVQIVPKENA